MISFKSFRQIEEDTDVVFNLFKNKKEYLAHSPDETIYEHLNQVKKYFYLLIDYHKLENIIENLIRQICFQNKQFALYLKEMFFHTVIFHDFGKINPNFQLQKLGNKSFIVDDKISIGSEHSYLSAYLFLNFYIDKITFSKIHRNEQLILYIFAFLNCIPILKHHSGFFEKDYNYPDEKIKTLQQFLSILDLKITFEQFSRIIKYECSTDQQNLWTYFNQFASHIGLDFFALFVLLKLNYSLLTASDYYATSDYKNNLSFKSEDDFGLINEKLRKKILFNFDNNSDKPYNAEIIKEKEKFLNLDLYDLQIPNNENLNIIRQKMAAEVVDNIEKHKDEKIFYIEAPTGGGKTNMSMIAVRKLLEIHEDINKIFYVFPFTTLITQTEKVIKETFGLTNTEVTQLHSKSGYQSKNIDNEKDEVDANYDLRNQIDNLFINYPVTLLTHIRFFDILKSNKKDTNYLLHRLANSIVVIDELQSYNPAEWDKLKYYISNYSALLNIRFILMSATLPKLDKLPLPSTISTNFIELIPDAQKKYLTNPNFSQRVLMKTDLLNQMTDLPYLAKIVFEKSKYYAENRQDKFKNSVYTIIEFIFKKTASKFFEEINKINIFFDEIFVLSGTILEPRRKYIIEYLRDANNRKKKILLITTQVVEAGVDIDMDLGFKNQSLIDSDEQLAGRINRNINKQNCELYLFKYDKPSFVYGKDLRYEVTKSFSDDLISEILNKKDFKCLYEKVFEKIDLKNNSVYKENFKDYLANFSRFDFKSINYEFKLIEENNYPMFIPLTIPKICYGDTNNFSELELDFIIRNDCTSGDNKEHISGEKIWKTYKSIVENKDQRFNKLKDIKILNGIMSKFVISIAQSDLSKLSQYCEYNEETSDYLLHNYMKLNSFDLHEIYDLNSGLNHEKLNLSYSLI